MNKQFGNKLAITLGFVGLLFYLVQAGLGCGPKKAEDKTREVKRVPVRVMTLVPRHLQEILGYTGDIQPNRQVRVVPDIAGKIAKIFVEEGEYVEKGQLLAVLDTTALHLQKKQAQAALAVARANFEDARRNYQRMLDLKKQGSVSQQQFDKVELGYKAAKAQLQQAEAALNLVKHNLAVSVMRAPFSGFIGNRFINAGETINPMMPGGLGVVTLVDLHKVKITVNIPERDFHRIQVGMPAEISVDTAPGQSVRGKVVVKNPVADVTSRSFRVQIMADNPGYRMKSGMYARIKIIISEKDNVLALPVDAVLQEEGHFYVFRVEQEKARRVAVTTGISDGNWVEITSGVELGDVIVITGQRNLREGDLVQVVKQEVGQ